MIQANHPRFSCTSDMSLIIYGIIFSGPLMHTDTPSGTVLFEAIVNFSPRCDKRCLISVLRVTREFCLVIVNQIKSFFISLSPSTLAT